MILTTTQSLDGYEVSEYLGLVRGLIVRSPTISQSFFSGLKSIVGGKMGSYTAMCEQARAHAEDLLVQHAREKGADAVIGISFDAADVGGQVQASEVLCYGTAVKLKRSK